MPYQDIAAVWATLQFRTDSDSVAREILGHYEMQLALQPQQYSSISFAHVTWLKVLFDLQRLHLHKRTNDTKHILHPSTALACLVHIMRLRAPETDGLCLTDVICLNLPELIIHTVLSGLRALHLMQISLTFDQKYLLKTTWERSWSHQKLKPIFGPILETLWLEAINILPVVNHTEPGKELQPAGGFCELHSCVGGLSPLTGQPHAIVRELLTKLKNEASTAYFLPLYDILWGCEAALIDHASLKHDQQDPGLVEDEKVATQVIQLFQPEDPKAHGHYSASLILMENFSLVKQGDSQKTSEPLWKSLTKPFLADFATFMLSRNAELRDPDESISGLLNGDQGVIELTRRWTDSSPIGYDTVEGAEAYVVDCPEFHPVSFSALESQLDDATYIRESTKVVLKFDRFKLVTCPRCDKPINRARLVEPLVGVSQLIQDRIHPVRFTSRVAQLIESTPNPAPLCASQSSTSESRRDSRVSLGISSSATSRSDSQVSVEKKGRFPTLSSFRKLTSTTAGLSPQPLRPMQAVFSASGSDLVLWTTHGVDDEILILSTSGSSHLDHHFFCSTIRAVGCGTKCVVAVTHGGEAVIFERSQVSVESPRNRFKLDLIPGDVPYCVSVSRDDSHIAIGFGSHVTVLKLDEFKITKYTRINLLRTQSTEQVVNFSADGNAVIIASRATNRKNTTGQDTLIHFWNLANTSQDADILAIYPQLGKSGDDFGVRSVFYDNTNHASVLAACVQDKHNVAQLLGSKQPPFWTLSGIQCASQSHDGSIYCFVVQDSKVKLVAYSSSSRNITHEIDLKRKPTSKEDQLMILTASADPNIVYGYWNEGSQTNPKMKLARIDLKTNTTKAVDVQDLQARINVQVRGTRPES